MQKLRTLWQDLQLWRTANTIKELREMPTAYLLTQFALTTFLLAMLQTMLVPATKTYVDAFDKPGVPWWWALVGLWLLAWWAIQLGALIISITHGRALGEQLFAPAVKKRPYRFEAKPSRRIRNRH